MPSGTCSGLAMRQSLQRREKNGSPSSTTVSTDVPRYKRSAIVYKLRPSDLSSAQAETRRCVTTTHAVTRLLLARPFALSWNLCEFKFAFIAFAVV